MGREVVKKQCSGIFFATKNITSGLPGGYRNQLRESVKMIETQRLDNTDRELLMNCRKELHEIGEKDLGELLYNACKGSTSAPNLF